MVIIILLLSILTGCKFSKDNDLNSNTSNYNSVQNAEEAKKIYDTLYDKLYNEGKLIYYLALKDEYSVDDNLYFISLKQLKEDFDYDISDFKDDKGAICNTDISGIYFAKDEEKELGVTIMASLNGCSTYESNNKKS